MSYTNYRFDNKYSLNLILSLLKIRGINQPEFVKIQENEIYNTKLAFEIEKKRIVLDFLFPIKVS